MRSSLTSEPAAQVKLRQVFGETFQDVKSRQKEPMMMRKMMLMTIKHETTELLLRAAVHTDSGRTWTHTWGGWGATATSYNC